MADRFGIPQLIDYLTHMGLRISNVDQEQEIIELAFHGDNGQWRLIVNIQQNDEIRKLIYDKVPSSELRTRAREIGMRTLREDGARKVLAGLTSPEEVIRATLGDVE